MRVGFGYDVHPLVRGRDLILGGVHIPFETGLWGHSDADVLCHAVGDALLGALGLGDLGTFFPDTDPQYKGISSLKLLERIASLLSERTARVVSVDSTVVAERPRLKPHVPEMRQNIARALGTSPDAISVKATTTEGLGFCGRGEGIAAYAVAVVSEAYPLKP